MQEKRPISLSLDGGIRLHFVENDRCKTNYIHFYFVTPLTEENASAASLLSRVLIRGCEKYPDQISLNRALDDCYDATVLSDVFRIGEWHVFDFSLCLLDNAYAITGEDITGRGLEIAREILTRPYLPGGVFSKEYTDGERRLCVDEIRAQINAKARFARQRMTELMCRGEAYAVNPLGTVKALTAIDEEKLTAFYRYMLSTARIEVFFVGRFDRERMTAKTVEIFKGVQREPVSLAPAFFHRAPKKIREKTEKMAISQANLAMGFTTDTRLSDKDWRAFSLYNSMLGGSLTSKLFTVIREKMSLCYHISSAPDSAKGVMLVYAGIAPEKKDVVVREVLHQMDLMQKGEFSEEEMESARGAIRNSINGLWDSPGSLAEWFLPRFLQGLFDTPTEVVKDLQKITREDVIRVAKKVRPDTVYFLTALEENQ